MSSSMIKRARNCLSLSTAVPKPRPINQLPMTPISDTILTTSLSHFPIQSLTKTLSFSRTVPNITSPKQPPHNPRWRESLHIARHERDPKTASAPGAIPPADPNPHTAADTPTDSTRSDSDLFAHCKPPVTPASPNHPIASNPTLLYTKKG